MVRKAAVLAFWLACAVGGDRLARAQSEGDMMGLVNGTCHDWLVTQSAKGDARAYMQAGYLIAFVDFERDRQHRPPLPRGKYAAFLSGMAMRCAAVPAEPIMKAAGFVNGGIEAGDIR